MALVKKNISSAPIRDYEKSEVKLYVVSLREFLNFCIFGCLMKDFEKIE